METQEFSTGTSTSGEKNDANIYTDAPSDNTSRTLLEDLMIRFEMNEEDAMDIIGRIRFMFLQ